VIKNNVNSEFNNKMKTHGDYLVLTNKKGMGALGWDFKILIKCGLMQIGFKLMHTLNHEKCIHTIPHCSSLEIIFKYIYR
jgi:hypothetical protein